MPEKNFSSEFDNNLKSTIGPEGGYRALFGFLGLRPRPTLQQTPPWWRWTQWQIVWCGDRTDFGLGAIGKSIKCFGHYHQGWWMVGRRFVLNFVRWKKSFHGSKPRVWPSGWQKEVVSVGARLLSISVAEFRSEKFRKISRISQRNHERFCIYFGDVQALEIEIFFVLWIFFYSAQNSVKHTNLYCIVHVLKIIALDIILLIQKIFILLKYNKNIIYIIDTYFLRNLLLLCNIKYL